MKKIVFSFLTLALVALTLSCSSDDQPFEAHNICEIGNTGKVVSSCNVLRSQDGSQISVVENLDLQYNPDYSKITAYDLLEGMPGIQTKEYSFILREGAVIDNYGDVVYDDFKFNDKGYVNHLVCLKGFSTSHGETHVTYDIVYNNEDRMSKITYKFMDAEEKPLRIQNIDLFWENGLLKSVTFDNNGEVTKTIYEYGNQTNVHHQPSVSFLKSLNMLSLSEIRPFLVAGYFGKGPDRFEVKSYEQQGTSVVGNESNYSVKLDEEGKIEELHEEFDEEYVESSHKVYRDYTFLYSDIKK